MHSSKLKKIKFLLFDLHGVILENETSGSGQQQDISLETVLSRLRNDLESARKLGLELGIISATEDDKLVESIRNIGLKEVLSHSIDKVSQAEKILLKYNLKFEEIAYIGDDILDLPLLAKVGFSATTRQARREVKRAVHYIIRNEDSKTVLDDILALIQKAKHGRVQ